MKRWLFYAGPENYLDSRGERDFADTTREWEWSAEPEVSKGDVVLLYRKSLSKVSIDTIVRLTGIPKEKAQGLRHKGIGSDIPSVWKVVASAQSRLAPGERFASLGHSRELIRPSRSQS